MSVKLDQEFLNVVRDAFMNQLLTSIGHPKDPEREKRVKEYIERANNEASSNN